MRFIKKSYIAFVNSHIIDYPTPLNLNEDAWSLEFGAVVCFILHIICGILYLIYFFAPPFYLFFLDIKTFGEGLEFLNFCVYDSLKGGWLYRYLHANGASMFFIVVYCHIFRGLFYGSYRFPREKLWVSGIIIFLLMIIINFLNSPSIEVFIKGVPFSDITLRDVFPFLIAGLVILHLSLHYIEGSNNPLGIDSNVQTIFFYPFFYAKELYNFFVLVFFLALLVVYYPNSLGHPDNYIPANPIVTPAHIVPEWYFLPFYAILRSIPDKLGGVLAMFSAIIVLMILPFLNTSYLRSVHFRPLYPVSYWFFLIDFIMLGWIGQQPMQTPYIEMGLLGTAYYFFFFLILLPVIGYIEFRLIYMRTYKFMFIDWEIIIED